MNLQHIAKAVRINDQMLHVRETMKSLLGDRYDARIADAQQFIRGVMKRDGKDVLPAALWICQRAEKDGHVEAVHVVIAAAVEMIERAGG